MKSQSYTSLRWPILTTSICTMSSNIWYITRKSPMRIRQYGEPFSFLQPWGRGFVSIFSTARRIRACVTLSSFANSFSALTIKTTAYLATNFIFLFHLSDREAFSVLASARFCVDDVLKIFHVFFQVVREQVVEKLRRRRIGLCCLDSQRLMHGRIHVERGFSSSSHKHLELHYSRFAAKPQIGKWRANAAIWLVISPGLLESPYRRRKTTKQNSDDRFSETKNLTKDI